MKKFFSGLTKRNKSVVQQAVGPSQASDQDQYTINSKDFSDDFQQEVAQLQARIDSTKNYPVKSTLPSSSNPFIVNVFLKQPLSLTDPSTSQCVIELRTSAASKAVERAPLELCLVLDRSGSMGGAKLTQAKEAISLVVNSSDPRDILHFVVYDTDAETIFRDGKVAQKAKLCESIAGVQAQGGTSLHSGLNAAMEILKKSDQGYAKRIFLFSDGQDGGNPTGDALCGIVAEWLTKGVNTSTFGIGTDFDAVIMKGIAAAGGGGFVYMSNSAEIPEKVGMALGALQSLAAKDLNLKIEVSDGVTLTNTYSYSGFSSGVDLGTMSAPDRKQVLLELKIKPNECKEVATVAAASVAVVAKADENEEPVPPGLDEGSSEQKEEKKHEVANTSSKTVSAFKWTLTYVDIQTNTEQKKAGEACATLTSDSGALAKASEHPLVVVTAVVAESADKDAAVLDLLNNGSDDAITRAVSIKKQTVERLKAVEHLDEMGAVTWLVKRMSATCIEMESRRDIQKMRQDVSYEQYQASSNLQCAGLV